MSPMPTPEYEEYLHDRIREQRRGVSRSEDQTPYRRRDAGGPAGRFASDPEPDPQLLEKDWRQWFARAHCGWARRYAPWLLKGGPDE